MKETDKFFKSLLTIILVTIEPSLSIFSDHSKRAFEYFMFEY